MTQTQLFGVLLILLGGFVLYLESQCKLLPTVAALYGDGSQLGKYLIALIIFILFLALVGEPYSSWSVAIVLIILLANAATNGELQTLFGNTYNGS